MRKLSSYVLLAGFSFLISSLAWAQATVNESLETITIYVDGGTGSDTNPGTQPQPLKTIGAAAAVALSNKASNAGTKVIVNPGTYRESLSLSGSPAQSAIPITFQAATNGTVFISGAQQFTGWTPYSGNSSVYTTSWPYQWRDCAIDTGGPPPEMPIVLRQEMIVVNGMPLTQVLSLSQMLYPGSFFADSTAGLVYIWPPTGVDVNTADVEVAVTPTLLTIAGHDSNNINGIVIRGLTFEYANSCHTGEAVYVQGSSTNILFDSDTFIWNNGTGLGFSSGESITVMNSISNHNGGAGFNTYHAKNILWQNDVASYNNWRGAQGAFYEWGGGGAHIFSDHGETISGFTATFNQTHSIHWDTDDVNISVTSLFAAQNMLGTLIEKNEGPVTFGNSSFCSTVSTATDNASGVVIRDSKNVTFNGNTFYRNSGSQLEITGVAGGFQISNWETGKAFNVSTENISLDQNVFEATTGQQLFRDSYLGGADWTTFATTLQSNKNTWWNPDNSRPFMVPAPVSATLLDSAEWQTSTGQDKNSTFSAPLNDPAAICAVTAEAPDYWFIVDNGVLTTNGSGKAVFNLSTIPLGGMSGNVALSADGVSSIPGASSSFSSSTITTAGASSLTFTAGPATQPGTYILTALANSGDTTRTIALQVTVPATSIFLSTDILTFNNQAVGTASAAQTLTVTNTGSRSIAIRSIAVNSGFIETNTCGTSLAAGKKCTIMVTFSPKQLLAYTGTLILTDSDPTSPQTVALTGTTVGSPAITFSHKSLSYGAGIFGTTSASQSVTLTNSGTALLALATISVTGADSHDFIQTNNCGSSLAIGALCTVTVTFDPTFTGSRTAGLTFADNAPLSPQTVGLAGTGEKALTVSPGSVGFGSVSTSSSATKAVTLTNASATAISITSFAFSGLNARDFSQTNNCNGTVQGNGSCSITVTFKPGATGSRSATLNANDSDPTTPQLVTLTGTGK